MLARNFILICIVVAAFAILFLRVALPALDASQ